MKGLTPLLLGIAGTLFFSWVGLALIPNGQFGHLEPQMDEEGNDAYPVPKSGMAERGRKVYVANGCVYCHTQQVRADYAGSDIERKWGERRSAPRDYLFDRPVLLGKMRMGPDLANIGKRAPAEDENATAVAAANPPAPGAPAPPAPSAVPAGAPSSGLNSASSSPAPPSVGPVPAGSATPVAPASAPPAAPGATAAASPAVASAGTSPVPSASAAANPAANAASASDAGPAQGGLPLYSAAWHHQHLYDPRSINPDSNMPAFRFLYERRKVSGERSADALQVVGHKETRDGWEIVPTYDARCLVAYLMSLDQSHALNEVKSATPPSPPAPGKGAK